MLKRRNSGAVIRLVTAQVLGGNYEGRLLLASGEWYYYFYFEGSLVPITGSMVLTRNAGCARAKMKLLIIYSCSVLVLCPSYLLLTYPCV